MRRTVATIWVLVAMVILAACGIWQSEAQNTEERPVLLGVRAMDPAVNLQDLKPGNILLLENPNRDYAHVSFLREQKRESPYTIRLTYDPYPGAEEVFILELCDACTPQSPVDGIALEQIQGKVRIMLDRGWYVSQALYVDTNLVRWTHGKEWAVIHAPDGDYYFREVSRVSNGAETMDVTYEVVRPDSTVIEQYTTSEGMTFSNGLVRPNFKFIVIPAEWYYEYQGKHMFPLL